MKIRSRKNEIEIQIENIKTINSSNELTAIENSNRNE
jgi:hypothetical protein